MAISFSNLHSEDGLKTLDEFLSRRTYISGDEITRDDIKVYGAVPVKPGSGFPNARRWYESISSVLAVRFPGEAVGVKIDGQPASPAPPSTKETKKDVEDADDEDDLDLFGDETEEKKAAAEQEASKASLQDVEDADDEDDLDLFGDETEEEKKAAAEREASKASSKKKESGKSSILMDVKPWDDETDMKKLEAAVRGIEIPGLLWGASQLVPVGYGIKKLQIMMTIVDDLVSVDNLIEDYLTAEPCNEHVQSCDIVAFNKI